MELPLISQSPCPVSMICWLNSKGYCVTIAPPDKVVARLGGACMFTRSFLSIDLADEMEQEIFFEGESMADCLSRAVDHVLNHTVFSKDD